MLSSLMGVVLGRGKAGAVSCSMGCGSVYAMVNFLTGTCWNIAAGRRCGTVTRHQMIPETHSSGAFRGAVVVAISTAEVLVLSHQGGEVR